MHSSVVQNTSMDDGSDVLANNGSLLELRKKNNQLGQSAAKKGIKQQSERAHPIGLSGHLGGDGNVRLVTRSTVGLVGFRHGRWRVMKDVGGY